jgi:hypothetical protein
MLRDLARVDRGVAGERAGEDRTPYRTLPEANPASAKAVFDHPTLPQVAQLSGGEHAVHLAEDAVDDGRATAPAACEVQHPQRFDGEAPAYQG